MLSNITILPATPRRWPDIEAMFGERGACGGCWCMAWRRDPSAWRAGKYLGNKRAFKHLVLTGQEPGVLAYLQPTPIGWCAVAPRGEYSYLHRSRVLRPVDQALVWSVSCLFVLKQYRRQGVSSVLLKGAVAHANSQGATIVEGYPMEPYTEHVPDPFLWTGTRSSFERAGFVEVARRSKNRPIMRWHKESPAVMSEPITD
jgi:GNAT superfamily N-acetyltransferase